ncbi:AraC family transcriptional regulator [Paenibacillus sp. N4]|uniref:AraC family transcriptional regulator n=1 Tax=Paenibacillus vietnamensis TaxID=2590547 RepID=UPI001CD119C3|nr:AraC family transcriptional regulator [Paenibacillus vietnamensis]MCA0757085.1 AraC family transcriptional regulator [Paenibacillus vietnamensis]
MPNLTIFNELSEHVSLRINSCRVIAHPGGYAESKQHKDYDLWYLYEGQIAIRIQDQVHIASAGDLVLFSPKVAYTAATLGAGCKFIYIHFDFGLGNHLRILDNYPLSGVIPNPLVREEIGLFLEAYDQYEDGARMSGIRFKGGLMILIAKIVECYGQGDYRGGFTPNESETKQTGNLQTLQPVFDFIHDRLHQPLRIGELAALVGMSEKYFIYYFKKSLGVTPGVYIYQLKMNRARELLYSGQHTIQQIAGMLGYPDPYSFSKAFKKYYKVPPSQFV